MIIAQSIASERVIYDPIQLFSSKEGEMNEEGNELWGICLNAMCVNEEFVEDVNRFVKIVDLVFG